MAGKSYDIVLVFPPIRVWDRPRNFPTGIGILAAVLRNAGFRVGMIDVNGLRLSENEVLEKLVEYNAPVIGIGGLITTYGWVKSIMPRIRQTLPGVKIVMGGSLAVSIAETALRKLKPDVVVMGEGERTIVELLSALKTNRDLSPIKGLAYLCDNEIHYTPPRELIANLDELPYPAWDRFPMDVYLTNPVVGVGKDIDIISSRGCPFGCRYCYHFFGRRYRARSAAHVVDEMKALKRVYDIDFVSFQDDCFVIDKKRVYEICDLIDASRILQGMRWSCTGRVTVCDADMLKRMRASGCISVSYGVESGSQKILNAMGKAVSLDQTREAIRNTRAAKMRCPVSFMIGYPGETPETVAETVTFCQEMDIPLSALMFTCPYPGTALYDEVKDKFADEEELVLKMGDAVDLAVNLTDMSDEELFRLRAEALASAAENYHGPTTAEAEAEERELYGEELFWKGKLQMADPAMQAHRARHGFNEGKKGEAAERELVELPGWVGGARRPYIIAEAGVNHNGDVATALEMVEQAHRAGADCVKFQAFSAEELTTPDAPKAEYQKQDAAEENQYDMLKKLELNADELGKIKEKCTQVGIDFLATPFSVEWVKKLLDLGVNSFKIGSGNLNDLDLLTAIGNTHLPVILSTGMAETTEAVQATNRLRKSGASNIAILHCVSMYPTPLEQANLNVIRKLAKTTGCLSGFSDHTQEVITGALAAAAGAVILEKHFTLDKNMTGPDHRASLEPGELAEYVRLTRMADTACGSGEKKILPEEWAVRKVVRGSVVAATDIKAGTTIERNLLKIKRPGTGIPADEIGTVIGNKAARDIKKNEILKIEDLQLAN